jgi:hypothetical protein
VGNLCISGLWLEPDGLGVVRDSLVRVAFFVVSEAPVVVRLSAIVVRLSVDRHELYGLGKVGDSLVEVPYLDVGVAPVVVRPSQVRHEPDDLTVVSDGLVEVVSNEFSVWWYFGPPEGKIEFDPATTWSEP